MPSHLATFEQGEIGPDLFRRASLLGLEGMVSKHRDLSRRPVPTPDQRQEPAASPRSAGFKIRSETARALAHATL